jgi:flagellar L-ring protein FlgH
MLIKCFKNSCFFLACSVLQGCMFWGEKPDDLSYAPAFPESPILHKAQQGSIFSQSDRLSLYEDMKAHRVGDIITVILGEKLTSKKSATSDWSKSSDVSMTNPTVLGSSVLLNKGKGVSALSRVLKDNENLNLSASVGGESSFTGQSSAKQSNQLSGTVTVTIAQILPNGNLYVKGERWITINNGEELVRISGIVRPHDIAPDNTIFSQRIADARIRYSGEGALANSNKTGWLVEFFSGPWWPF